MKNMSFFAVQVEVTQVGNSLRSLELFEKEGNERMVRSDEKLEKVEKKFLQKETEAIDMVCFYAFL